MSSCTSKGAADKGGYAGNSAMSIERLSMDMTVMHIDNNSIHSNKSVVSMKSTDSRTSHEREKTDEEIKQFASEDPVIKGNKQLSVEVKLSDLIRYGALGQGASGYVEKAVHRPTKKIIALKVIAL